MNLFCERCNKNRIFKQFEGVWLCKLCYYDWESGKITLGELQDIALRIKKKVKENPIKEEKIKCCKCEEYGVSILKTKAYCHKHLIELKTGEKSNGE